MNEGELQDAELSPVPKVQLQAIDLEGWPTSRARARTTLSTRRTILVGRNGAGKSLLIDGLYSAAGAFVGTSPRTTISLYDAPSSFRFEFSLPDRKETLVLSTRWARNPDQSSEIDRVNRPLNRTERCWIAETNRTLWSLDKELATAADGKTIPVPPGLGLLSFGGSTVEDIKDYTERLKTFLLGLRRIDAGLPRHGKKEFIVVRRSGSSGAGVVEPHLHDVSRVGLLAEQLADAFEQKSDKFHEFSALASQLGLAKAVTVDAIASSINGQTRIDDSNRTTVDRFLLVNFDRVNIGQLSDGTLRVAEILWTLVSLQDSEMLLLEEPETGIHPGLLSKLLPVIDSYALGHQVVISTHSIQVVNWASADEIRLVTRNGSNVASQELRAEQLDRVAKYLQEEGTLAEFLYNGGADD